VVKNGELMQQIKIHRISIDSLALFVIASGHLVESLLSLFVDLEIKTAIFRRWRFRRALAT